MLRSGSPRALELYVDVGIIELRSRLVTRCCGLHCSGSDPHPLPHGLTEAAVNALKQCRFTPGQKNGNPVAVRVRGFKIWFLMRPAE
jgi:hypothetical protein